MSSVASNKNTFSRFLTHRSFAFIFEMLRTHILVSAIQGLRRYNRKHKSLFMLTSSYMHCCWCVHLHKPSQEHSLYTTSEMSQRHRKKSHITRDKSRRYGKAQTRYA